MIPFVVTLWRFLRAVARSLKDPDFQALLFLVVVTLLSGTLFYSRVEEWSLLDSFYFSAVTLTTVGYGDLSPSTAAGKIFTVVYLFVGIGIVLGFVDAVAKRSLEGRTGLFGRHGRRPEPPEDRQNHGRHEPPSE